MPVILQTRGPCTESTHPFSAVGVRQGQVVVRWGESVQTTWRSAAKPFQLATSLALLGDPDVSEAELAVGAASHSAEPQHLALVRGLLQRFDLAEAGLRCGGHPPVHNPSAEAILRAGGHFSDIHNNCSGKHTFMLAAASRNGWDADYRPPDHPLQQAIRQDIARWTGAALDTALDGCGVPTFCLQLQGIARAWAVLAAAMDHAEDAEQARLQRIGRAMAARPDLTSGTDRLDLSVARHAREPMAVKIGAQGVFCIALPQRQLGLAIKVHTGSSEALALAVAATLERAAPGAWSQPQAWPFAQVRNVIGALAGDYQLRSDS